MTGATAFRSGERARRSSRLFHLAGAAAAALTIHVGSPAALASAQAPESGDAAPGGCLVVKNSAEKVSVHVNENGERVERLVPAAKVVPGDEVVWTVTVSNGCDAAAENVAIANPIPEDVAYVASSAAGPGTEVSFSLDGEHFAAPAELTVRESDGTVRAARPEEYRHVRWVFRNPVQPGAIGIARFRAVVK